MEKELKERWERQGINGMAVLWAVSAFRDLVTFDLDGSAIIPRFSRHSWMTQRTTSYTKTAKSWGNRDWKT